jgi:hypothetical protein
MSDRDRGRDQARRTDRQRREGTATVTVWPKPSDLAARLDDVPILAERLYAGSSGRRPAAPRWSAHLSGAQAADG